MVARIITQAAPNAKINILPTYPERSMSRIMSDQESVLFT